MTTADVIVLGVGGFGSAACADLARQGVRVVGLEQFAPAHTQGSSHGETRIIRQAYFEHPDYVPLLMRSYELWRELERETGRHLLQITGLLLAGPPDGEAVPGALHAAQLHQLPLEQLSHEETTQRFPGLSLPPEHSVVFEPAGGFLLVEDCVRAHIELARRHGADLRFSTPIRSLTIQQHGVEIVTDAEVFSAAKVVVTAGAWTSQLLKNLDVPLTVLRKFLGWFRVSPGAYQREAGFPCFYIEQGKRAFYGFPSLNGQDLKIAEHTGGDVVVDPAQVARDCRADDVAPLQGALRTCFPRATSELTRFGTCLYTMTPDQHFLVDRLPDAPHVVLGAGFSGHGFKFTSVLGAALADLSLHGQSSLPIGFLGLNRFAD